MECNNTGALVAQADKIDDLDSRPIAIRATNVIKKYKVGKQIIRAIDDVSVDIHEGEFVALVGPSGSGKSTLLHLLGGLDKPTSGEIVVGGKNVSSMNDRQLSKFRNQTIGFVFQSFYLQPFLTLRRNIEVASMPQRMGRAERKLRIESLARQVGLYDRLSHRPHELSGGQIQRAAIARALLNRPAIILADEPTGNLDSANSRDIISLFQQIREQYHTTIVIATHDNEIAAQADRVIALKDGRLCD
jgi:putative ABC transport system ATP-binding protein